VTEQDLPQHLRFVACVLNRHKRKLNLRFVACVLNRHKRKLKAIVAGSTGKMLGMSHPSDFGGSRD